MVTLLDLLEQARGVLGQRRGAIEGSIDLLQKAVRRCHGFLSRVHTDARWFAGCTPR